MFDILKLGMDEKWRETLKCYFDIWEDQTKRIIALNPQVNKKWKVGAQKNANILNKYTRKERNDDNVD